MALSTQLIAAYWLGFALAIVALILYGLIWFFLSVSKVVSAVTPKTSKSLKKIRGWFETANLAFWGALIGMALIIAAMNLALVIHSDARNTFILRTATLFPFGTECTQAFVDDGICVVWIRWIFYTGASALFTIALGMFFSIS